MSVWVPLLVHESDYLELAELVASRAKQRGDALPAVGVVHAADEASPAAPGDSFDWSAWQVWPKEALQRLAKSPVLTAQRWAKAMDVCAEAADGDWLTTSEVADRAGMELNEWRDAPRKITRHLKVHYSDAPADTKGHIVWPLRPKTFPGSAEVSWAMPPATKQTWVNLPTLTDGASGLVPRLMLPRP